MKTSDTSKVKVAKTEKKTAAKKKTNKAVDKNDIKDQVIVKENNASVKTCANCSTCQDEMTDAFIKEVTEDVKNDNLKAFWNKYGLYVILFVTFAVCSAVGFETIKSWHQRQLQLKTEAYVSAMVREGNYENSIKALEKIAVGNYGVYSELARLQIADILFEQNKLQDALNMLKAIVDNDKLSVKVRHLATLKLASYMIDEAPAAEVKALLEPVVNENTSWSPLAQEMLAMVAIKEGNFDKARQIYNDILQNVNASDNFRARIQDMLSALNDM